MNYLDIDYIGLWEQIHNVDLLGGKNGITGEFKYSAIGDSGNVIYVNTNTNNICRRFYMDKKNDWNLELSEYIKQGEPNKIEKTKAWETAIGLQDVDGLKTSKYLIKTAKEHIEGNINIKEAKARINQYYEALDSRKNIEKKENEEVIRIKNALSELKRARSNFDMVVGADNVELAILELNAAEKRYQNLIKEAKQKASERFLFEALTSEPKESVE
mgnify:CR=1 FL=1